MADADEEVGHPKMAIIIRDPLVADYIVEREIDSDENIAEVRRLYEEGYLVLLRGVHFELDYAFLNTIDFDVSGPPETLHKVKKCTGKKFLAMSPTSTGPVETFVFQNIFGSDAGKLAYFQEQVRHGNEQSDALYAKIFPKYVATRTVHTWRLTETMFENLHWDVFGIPEPFHQVRIFTNLSSSPRLWRISHHVDDFAERIYDERGLSQFAGTKGDDLVRFINNDVLAGKTPCLDHQPKHHIAFEQAEVWICETRLLAHQIYHGDRAFATMYFSELEAMDRPELAFEARIERLHQRRGRTAAPESLAQ